MQPLLSLAARLHQGAAPRPKSQFHAIEPTKGLLDSPHLFSTACGVSPDPDPDPPRTPHTLQPCEPETKQLDSIACKIRSNERPLQSTTTYRLLIGRFFTVPVLDPPGGGAGYGGGYGDYSGYGGYGGGSGYGGYGGSQAEEGGGEEGGDTSGYSAPGQAPFYGYDPHGAQKPEFVSNVDGAGALEDGDGFVSPFDALSSNSRTPQPQANQYAPSSYSRNQQATEEDLDDDDDLGLGNSSRRNKASGATERDGDAGSAGGDVSRQESVSSATSGAAGKEDGSNDGASAASEEKRQELKSSASWFGRLWGRSSSTDSAAQQAQAKAKKAHLGEETSFVYDKELKRWVNKKVGESAGAASTPPPPPPPAR
ncbi:uncharacterized conserved protein [Moesziomyces antarcticus T-34]|uniref:Uncharacterized conserved protein n=1 Tax=Pseudozyma antarctica (strain T-34) TaxID=1151754 RepID=M9MAL2_PSEA3|nr:uncharacterized conserved protein [Moesziomyces antarcticus T-34]